VSLGISSPLASTTSLGFISSGRFLFLMMVAPIMNGNPQRRLQKKGLRGSSE